MLSTIWTFALGSQPDTLAQEVGTEPERHQLRPTILFGRGERTAQIVYQETTGVFQAGTTDPGLVTVYAVAHPRGLMVTSGGWAYCEQVRALARRTGYTLLCGRYAQGRVPGLRAAPATPSRLG